MAPGDVRSAFGGRQRERAYHDAIWAFLWMLPPPSLSAKVTVALACPCPPASRDLIVSTARTEILVKMGAMSMRFTSARIA